MSLIFTNEELESLEGRIDLAIQFLEKLGYPLVGKDREITIDDQHIRGRRLGRLFS
jgi:hypothetical protein